MSSVLIVKRTNSDELYHHGILGQKWGVRRYQNADGSLTILGRRRLLKNDVKYAKVGNKITEKNGEVLTRKRYSGDDPAERKKRIDADIKEADDRVKYYGSKRAAKAAIKDEAEYAKNINRAKAAVDTLKFGGSGAVAGSTLMTLAGGSSAAVAAGAAAPLIGVGLVSAAAAKKANDYINKHAKDQILYTQDSEYAHDYVVTFKKK